VKSVIAVDVSPLIFSLHTHMHACRISNMRENIMLN
jgi:hypothetical protein